MIWSNSWPLPIATTWSDQFARAFCLKILIHLTSPQPPSPPQRQITLRIPLGLFVVYPVHGYTTRVVPQVGPGSSTEVVDPWKKYSRFTVQASPPSRVRPNTLDGDPGVTAPAVGSCTHCLSQETSALFVHLAINQFDQTVESHLKQISGEKSVWLVGIGAYIARSKQGAL